jgi:hypothetical protein
VHASAPARRVSAEWPSHAWSSDEARGSRGSDGRCTQVRRCTGETN